MAIYFKTTGINCQHPFLVVSGIAASSSEMIYPRLRDEDYNWAPWRLTEVGSRAKFPREPDAPASEKHVGEPPAPTGRGDGCRKTHWKACRPTRCNPGECTVQDVRTEEGPFLIPTVRSGGI